MKMTEVATFNRVNASDLWADGNKGFEYGIEWVDGEEVVEVEWHKTEAEREQAIDEFFKAN